MKPDELSTAELEAITLEEVETIYKRKYAVHQLNGNSRRKCQFQQIYCNLRKYPENCFLSV